jgi:GT2 family glycosyltransferase
MAPADPYSTPKRHDPNVLAIVLTYSAPDALVGCIRALQAQSVSPDEVLVVDNAGEPPAERTLAAAGVHWDRMRLIREPENTGPAGGHAKGLREFLASDHDLAWVMDDDRIQEAGCLQALLDATGGRNQAVFVFPNWVTPDGEMSGYPAWSGFLISRDVVRRAGVPRSELVWWGEDTEYLMWRIPDAGFESELCKPARVLHASGRATATRPGWKYYYEARNSVYLRLHYRRHRSRLVRVLGRLIARVALLETHRARKLWLLLRGTIDGLRGRLGMQIPIGTDHG